MVTLAWRRSVHDTKNVTGKFLADLGQLPQQTLKVGPVFEMEKLNGCFIQRSTLVLRIIDIQDHKGYFLFHRRLSSLLDHVVWPPRLATHLEGQPSKLVMVEASIYSILGLIWR